MAATAGELERGAACGGRKEQPKSAPEFWASRRIVS